jgi:hypothetical protein
MCVYEIANPVHPVSRGTAFPSFQRVARPYMQVLAANPTNHQTPGTGTSLEVGFFIFQPIRVVPLLPCLHTIMVRLDEAPSKCMRVPRKPRSVIRIDRVCECEAVISSTMTPRSRILHIEADKTKPPVKMAAELADRRPKNDANKATVGRDRIFPDPRSFGSW